jgi:hypothetical protein
MDRVFVHIIIGFFTSYPANRFLLRKRWKEAMPQCEAELKSKMRQSLSSARPVDS